MPPRLITGAILVFWLGMTGLLIHREVVPMMLAEVAPAYQIDLTDEIGSPLVGWVILLNEKRIGSGTSKIHVNEDRTYEFRSSVRFDDFSLLNLHMKQWENMYRVTEEGKLQMLSTKFVLGTPHQRPALALPDTTIEIEGVVVARALQPRMLYNGNELKFSELGKIDVSQQGNIVNPMHPVNRLRGLRKGQIWKITLFDPLGAIQNQLVGDLGKQGMTIPTLIAEVKTDTFEWDRKEVPCYKIEYSEPGKEVTARTWVRRSDGLVLQQEATHFGYHMKSQRIPH